MSYFRLGVNGKGIAVSAWWFNKFWICLERKFFFNSDWGFSFEVEWVGFTLFTSLYCWSRLFNPTMLKRSLTTAHFILKSRRLSVLKLGLRLTSKSHGFKFSSINMSKPRSSKQLLFFNWVSEPLKEYVFGTNISTPFQSSGSPEITVFIMMSSILENSFSISIGLFCCSVLKYFL